MATRNHGNRLFLANEQNEFFYFHNKNVLRFQKNFNQKHSLQLKKPVSANFSSK